MEGLQPNMNSFSFEKTGLTYNFWLIEIHYFLQLTKVDIRNTLNSIGVSNNDLYDFGFAII